MRIGVFDLEEDKSKIDWETISLNLIVNAGSAKSCAMEALTLAKKRKFEEAKVKMQDANKLIAKASHEHFSVIQKESQGFQLKFKVLFMHAEDQLLTTQTLLLVIEELINIYKVIKKEA